MTLTPAFLDELRDRTLLSALVGRAVKLQRAGREWKACCPFHTEKTPSFYVNDEKHFYHCFGCQAHGDAIRWLTDARGLPFIDAVKELADAAGMEMPALDRQAQEKTERAQGLHAVMEAAQVWFEEQLGGLEGAEARAYLKARGISEATRQRFGFGYAPDARGKLRAALNEFGIDKLVEAGLLIAPDEGREPYDRFRRRLTFPIRDRRGRVVAFSARILGQGEPKYLNSPDTPLFDKGRTLFNIDKASPASREKKRLIVVEGQMDVIALDQAGFPECVAPLGTAVTDTQLEMLWRLTDKPIFCFDGDLAGQQAAVRAAKRALPHIHSGHTLGFISLPPGQDPDDLLRAGGTAALLAWLAKPEGLADRIWRAELGASEVATPEGRAGLKQRLHELANSVRDSYVREQYRAAFNDRFWEQFGWRRQQVEIASNEIANSRKAARAGFHYTVRRAILLGLSRYPDVLAENLDLTGQLIFPEGKLQGWFDVLSSAVLERPDLSEDLIETILVSSHVAPIEKRNLAKDLAFSFFKRHEPERGRHDLREVIGTLVAEQEVEGALAAASERLKEQTQTPEWDEQQRLLNLREEVRNRLKRMAEDAGKESGSAARVGAPGSGPERADRSEGARRT